MSPDPSSEKRVGLLNRLKSRIENYRELGRQRRGDLGLRSSPSFIPDTTLDQQALPPAAGVARGVLSAADFTILEERIGYVIKYRAYFLQALTHRSYLQFVNDPTMLSNERLEFLGDAVLDLVIGEYLYREFQSLPEGELTKLRSRLVSGTSLARHASDIGLGQFMLLSTSAFNALERGSVTLLADAYEAVIAAIYLDGGMSAARDFVYKQIITHSRRDELLHSDTNYKSMLLEYAQGKKLGVPRYITVNEEGPNHARMFTVEVLVAGVVQGGGQGRSKKEAEQMAAKLAVERIAAENGSIPVTE